MTVERGGQLMDNLLSLIDVPQVNVVYLLLLYL